MKPGDDIMRARNEWILAGNNLRRQDSPRKGTIAYVRAVIAEREYVRLHREQPVNKVKAK